VPLCRQHSAVTGVGGRCLGPAVRPGFEVIEGVDDTATDLPISGTGAVGPMLFQCAIRETEESRGFGCAQVTRWKAGTRIGHCEKLRDRLERQRGRWRVGDHDLGEAWQRGMPKKKMSFSAPPEYR
jgi:hypothetical protein